MNNCELVKEIMLDFPLVDRKARYLAEECRRTAVKSKDRSYFHIFEYKSKRQNNWLIVISFIKCLACITTIVYYRNEQGINAIAIGENGRFHWYTPHFLTRYNERFLKQENCSRLDLLKRFISVNKVGIAEVNPINQTIFCRFTEGIGLGDIETINYQKSILHLRTFISNPMIFEDQQQTAKSAGKFYDFCCQELKKYTGIKSL